VINEFKAFFTLFQQGKLLTNSTTWKNRTTAANAVGALIGAGIIVARGFGYDLHLDTETTQALGAGVFACYSVYNAVITTITSAKVGVPPSAGDGPSTEPTASFVTTADSLRN
jgi:hypothetical protein